MSEDSLSRLEEALGYAFRDRTLLTLALTHSSLRPELSYSNERLEFLGDAILGCVVSETLYRSFPDYAEGALTRIKSVVVSRTSLTRTARQLNLEAHLIVAKGVVQANGKDGCDTMPPSLIANAFEAIVAAVYLDGGWEPVREFVSRHMCEEIERARKVAAGNNGKSALQEYAQRNLGVTPTYRIASETGPDHVKQFEVITVIGDQTYGIGHGATKKAAEQMAAELTLEMLQEKTAEKIADALTTPPEEPPSPEQ